MAYRSRPVQIRSAVPLSIRAPKDRAVRLPGRTRSHSRPYAPDPLHHPYLRNECYSAFRRPLQFIVMSVTVVMDGTFPIPIGFLHDGELVAYPRASRHRHGQRHGEIGLCKRLPRYHDGHDAHDGHLRACSRHSVNLNRVHSLPRKALFTKCVEGIMSKGSLQQPLVGW